MNETEILELAEKRGRIAHVHQSRLLSRFGRIELCAAYGVGNWLDIPSAFRTKLYRAFYDGLEQGQGDAEIADYHGNDILGVN